MCNKEETPKLVPCNLQYYTALIAMIMRGEQYDVKPICSLIHGAAVGVYVGQEEVARVCYSTDESPRFRVRMDYLEAIEKVHEVMKEG